MLRSELVRLFSCRVKPSFCEFEPNFQSTETQFCITANRRYAALWTSVSTFHDDRRTDRLFKRSTNHTVSDLRVTFSAPPRLLMAGCRPDDQRQRSRLMIRRQTAVAQPGDGMFDASGFKMTEFTPATELNMPRVFWEKFVFRFLRFQSFF